MSSTMAEKSVAEKSAAEKCAAEKSAAEKSAAEKVLDAINTLLELPNSKDFFGSVLNNIFDVLKKKLEAGHVGRNLYPMNAFTCISACFGLVKSFGREVLDLAKNAQTKWQGEGLMQIEAALKNDIAMVDDIRKKIEVLGKMLEEKILMHDNDTHSDVYILFDLKFDLIGVDLESCTEKLIKVKGRLETGFVSVKSYEARRQSAAKAGGIAVLGAAASAALATPSAISALLPVIGICCTIGAVAAVGVLPLGGIAYIAYNLRQEMAHVESVQEQYKQVDEKFGKLNDHLETLKKTMEMYGNAHRSIKLREENELFKAQILKDQEQIRELKKKLAEYTSLSLIKT